MRRARSTYDSASAAARRKADGGFTVIELMIAFTILAIVSGSLFQVFRIAERNNAYAARTDAAVRLAESAAEAFKQDPALERAPLFAEAGGELKAEVWKGAAGAADTGPLAARYVRYYDAQWQPLPMLLVTGGAEPQAPEGAAYRLDAALERTASATTIAAAAGDESGAIDGNDASNPAVATALLIPLAAQGNYRLVIQETGDGGAEAVFNGERLTVDAAAAQAQIPVTIQYDPTGAAAKTVVVLNKTKKPVNVTVIGTPDKDRYESYVRVSAAEGSVTVMASDSEAAAGASAYYAFHVSVCELDSDGDDEAGELAALEVGKYVAG